MLSFEKASLLLVDYETALVHAGSRYRHAPDGKLRCTRQCSKRNESAQNRVGLPPDGSNIHEEIQKIPFRSSYRQRVTGILPSLMPTLVQRIENLTCVRRNYS